MSMDTKLPKSKRYIRKAFLELLGEMSFQEITVKNIAERSELGRATFYLHYKDKTDLLEEIENDLINGLLALIKKTQSVHADKFMDYVAACYHPGFTEYFRYMKENSEAFLVLFASKNGTNFYQRFSNDVQEFHVATHKWLSNGADNSAVVDVVLRLGAANFVNIFKVWLETEMTVSEENMSRFLTGMWHGYILGGKNLAPESFYGELYNSLMQKTNH